MSVSTTKPRPRNAREGLDRMAARLGWAVETGVKSCGHHWSKYRVADVELRVDWTFSQHIRYATLRSDTVNEDAPTRDTPWESHHARFAWAADLLYRKGDMG